MGTITVNFETTVTSSQGNFTLTVNTPNVSVDSGSIVRFVYSKHTDVYNSNANIILSISGLDSAMFNTASGFTLDISSTGVERSINPAVADAYEDVLNISATNFANFSATQNMTISIKAQSFIFSGIFENTEFGILYLKNFFGGHSQPKLSDYVRGGQFVPDINQNRQVPTSPPIRLRNFVGTGKLG